MALVHNRAVGALDPALTLAPERWDPRRMLEGEGPRLDRFVHFSSERVAPSKLADDALVLDTGHAFEGVVLRKAVALSGRPKSSKWRLLPGDVVVSRLRPYLRQVALIDEGLFVRSDGQPRAMVVCSSEFYVLRARTVNGPAPACLVPYLLSEPVQTAFAAAQSGGHHPRVPRELLESLPWPFESREDADAQAALVTARIDGIRRAFQDLEALGAAPGT